MHMREIGRRAEEQARAYLEQLGYAFVAANVHVGHNELDIIMRDGDYLVFVEVKARSSEQFGLGREFVDIKKQRRLIAAAEGYLCAHDPDTSARFDVVEVDLNTNRITHIPNAFSA